MQGPSALSNTTVSAACDRRNRFEAVWLSGLLQGHHSELRAHTCGSCSCMQLQQSALNFQRSASEFKSSEREVK